MEDSYNKDIEDIENIKKNIWNWFGDHACFIGGLPLTKNYRYENAYLKNTTPFKSLYFIYPTEKIKYPMIALSIIEDYHDKIYDSYGILIDGVEEMEDNQLMLFNTLGYKYPPEVTKYINKDKLIDIYPKILKIV